MNVFPHWVQQVREGEMALCCEASGGGEPSGSEVSPSLCLITAQ